MNRNRLSGILVSVVAVLGLGSGVWAGLADSPTSTGLDSLLGKPLGITGNQSKGGKR